MVGSTFPVRDLHPSTLCRLVPAHPIAVGPPVTQRPPQVSRPRELHPQPLVKPDVRLSTHPASIIHPALGALPRMRWPSDTLGDATPLLSPRSQASSLLRVAPPLGTLSVRSPSWFGPLGTFPVVACRHPTVRQVPVVHTCASVEVMPPLRRTPAGWDTGTLQTLPRMDLRPWFRGRCARFRRVISGALACISSTSTTRSIAAPCRLAHDHGA